MSGMIVWVVAIALPNYAFLALEVVSRSLVRSSLVVGLFASVTAALIGSMTYDWLAASKGARVQKQQARKGLRVRLASLTPHTPLSV
jgi:hypothetical protein